MSKFYHPFHRYSDKTIKIQTTPRSFGSAIFHKLTSHKYGQQTAGQQNRHSRKATR